MSQWRSVHPIHLWIPLALALVAPGALVAQASLDRPLTVDEVRRDFERMSRPGGYWATSNEAYALLGAGEPDEYRMAFTLSPDGFGLRGCMWGATQATQTAPFWYFFHAWDPGRQAVLAYQASPGGSVALGWERRASEGGREGIQTMHSPSGEALEIRHLNHAFHTDSILSRSFHRDSTGSDWEARRSYTWVWRVATEPVPC